MDAAIALANRVAPEHLEVLMREPWSVLPRIRHAGAVFLGPYAPEPLGDYFAGPNHVLPTLGTARFSSALSVQTFCKRTSIIAASPAFAAANADAVARLARMEAAGGARARSMELRGSGSSVNVQSRANAHRTYPMTVTTETDIPAFPLAFNRGKVRGVSTISTTPPC